MCDLLTPLRSLLIFSLFYPALQFMATAINRLYTIDAICFNKIFSRGKLDSFTTYPGGDNEIIESIKKQKNTYRISLSEKSKDEVNCRVGNLTQTHYTESKNK